MTRHASPKPAGAASATPSRAAATTARSPPRKQADFKTALPKFKGTTLSYAPCGYTGPQYRSAYEGDTTPDRRGRHRRDHRRLPLAAHRSDAEKYAAQHGDGSYAAGQLTENLPSGYNSEDALRPVRLERRGDPRRRGRPRHGPGREHPLLRLVQLHRRRLPRHARAGRRRGRRAGRLELVGRRGRGHLVRRGHRVRDGLPAGRPPGHQRPVLLRRQR